MATSLYYCDNCGAANPAQAATCFACGQPLQTTPPAPIPIQAPVPIVVGQPQGTSQQAGAINQVPTIPGTLAPNHVLKQRYRILGQVGKGGFGTVYTGMDFKANNRPVAVKEVNPSGQNPQEIAEATEAFKREAQLLTGLAHLGLPRIYDHFSEVGCWYLVMDFIEGETLDEHLNKARGGRLPIVEVLVIGMQLCNVLDYLHNRQQPIIFRDLKPGNIMLTPTGHVYLIDFGIARHFKAGQAKDTMAFGSPGYAAPEQYGRAQTTPRSDIYSLGATLHQLLTGNDPTQNPFRFSSPSSYDSSIPVALDTLIMQMLEMNESRRPPGMDNVKWELQRIFAQYRQQAALMPRSAVAPQPAVSPQPAAAAKSKPAKLQPVSLASLVSLVKKPAQAKRGLLPALPVSRRTVVKGLVGLGGVAAAGGIFLLLEGIQAAELAAHPLASSQPISMSPVPATPSLGTTLFFTYHGHSGSVDAVAWSPKVKGAPYSGRIASASEDWTVQVWDAADGSHVYIYRGHFDFVHAVAWSPDGRLLASGSSDKTVKVWDAKQGDSGNVFTYRGHTGEVHAVAWSPDGKRIASGSRDKTVLVWEPDFAALENNVLTYLGHTGNVNSVAWSPDGKRIASGSEDSTAQVWDATTGKPLVTYRGHLFGVNALAWSPDGKRIASGSDDDTVQVWEAATGDPIYIYRGHTSVVNALAWSSDGKRIASAAEDMTVRVWNAPYPGNGEAGGNVFIYRGHSTWVRAVAWSPDGKLIVSGSADDTVQVWEAR